MKPLIFLTSLALCLPLAVAISHKALNLAVHDANAQCARGDGTACRMEMKP